jgi:hypothetical protein
MFGGSLFSARKGGDAQEASNIKARLRTFGMSMERLDISTGGGQNLPSSSCLRHGVVDETPNDYYHVAKMVFRCVKVDGTN